jgi:hypothetical protein
MLRLETAATVLGLCAFLCPIGSANAARYCAHYIGGPERVIPGSARSECEFETLKDCRASVRERGGGTCYREGHVPRSIGR